MASERPESGDPDLSRLYELAQGDPTALDLSHLMAEFGPKLRFARQIILDKTNALDFPEEKRVALVEYGRTQWDASRLAADLEWIVAAMQAGVPPKLILNTWLKVDEDRRKQRESQTT